jgi:beta-glucosidase/6-phospho-beta-glucosidase/beta-galactosidase
VGLEFVGAFESTYLPQHDVDVFETTGHAQRWAADLALLTATGVRRLRYPVRWHRVEREAGVYDWRDTDRVLGHLHDAGLEVIVDLLHHTSYPGWLRHGFADERFGDAYLRYCEAFAARYPWVPAYTLFNEPFSTLFLCGHEAIWPPYHLGVDRFARLVANALPPVARASRMYADLLPDAAHVYVDTCERHTGGPGAETYAALANDRRFFVLDLFLGRALDTRRPFVDAVVEAGGAALLDMAPGRIDVLGLDYYAHSQWHFTPTGGEVPSPTPGSLASLIVEYHERYGLPCMLTETNIRGYASDRASWLKYTLEQCELAQEAGVPLLGYCWFPFVDSCDWDTLLFHCRGSVDPVGVYWLDGALERRPSSMSDAYALAARGTPASDLPAYRFRRPVADWLRGYLPQMAHWDWRTPGDEPCSQSAPPDDRIELRIRDAGD